MKRKCYTYYQKLDQPENQEDLIELCKLSWNINGWDFEVLDISHAESHPFYSEYEKIMSSLNFINSPLYEKSCFMRWLAMASVGGGVMIDYDVVNLGFSDFFNHYDEKNITLLQKKCPCVVYGNEDQYLDVCKRFCKLVDSPYVVVKNQEGTTHTSDMIMINSGLIKYNKKSLVNLFPDSYFNLTHCSYQSCFENNLKKSKAMKYLIFKKYFQLLI